MCRLTSLEQLSLQTKEVHRKQIYSKVHQMKEGEKLRSSRYQVAFGTWIASDVYLSSILNLMGTNKEKMIPSNYFLYPEFLAFVLLETLRVTTKKERDELRRVCDLSLQQIPSD